MKAGWIAIAGLFLATSARSQIPVTPLPLPAEQRAAALKHNQEILANTAGADGVFTVQDDGAIMHLQSGLVCPASFPNVALFHLLIYQSGEKGSDVGCDYIRPDDLGGAYAKLTIFATKAAPETTLDSAFAGYQREVAQVFKGAQPIGPAIRIEDKTGKMPEYRSEEYLIKLNERDNTSDLIVTVSAGWVIEIRATYAGKPDEIHLEKGQSAKDAAVAIGDRVMASTAYIGAVHSVGK